MWVVISISHVYADGGTMYKIFRMLDPSQPLIAYDRSTIPNLNELVEAHTGIHPEKGSSLKASIITESEFFAMLKRSLGRTFRGKMKPRVRHYKINIAYIE